jgi:1-deoxy-D-xylulose-5-phosphate reductoisomerase
MDKGGNMPCILNAANEIAVAGFLSDRVGFLEMSSIVEHCMEKMAYISTPSYDDYVYTDRETRVRAVEWLDRYN